MGSGRFGKGVSMMENSHNHRDATVEKLAAAMGLKPEQLVD